MSECRVCLCGGPIVNLAFEQRPKERAKFDFIYRVFLAALTVPTVPGPGSAIGPATPNRASPF